MTVQEKIGANMPLTEFQQEFKTSLLNITDNIDFIYAHYLAARKDEVRQKIIDGINNGTITSKNDIRAITIQQAPTYNYMVENDLLPDFMKNN